MIEHLADILTEFPGSANRTRCYAHILNLVAKAIMKQFDAPKGKTTGFEVALEEFEDELETEPDDNLTEAEGNEAPENDGTDDEIVDESRRGMSEEEISALDESVKPVRLVLFKVC
jgi:hypothetical protein